MKNSLIFSLFCLLLASCTERIDLELNPNNIKKLVVNAWFTNEAKPHEVYLSLTGDYYTNQTPEPATGAVVSISDGENTYSLTEETPGHYFTEAHVKGEAWKNYTLQINWNGENYSATSLLRPVTPIDSVQVRISDFQVDTDTLTDYGAFLFALEPSTLDDSYYWKVFLLDNPNDLVNTHWQIAEDDFVNGKEIGGAETVTFPAKPGDVYVFEQYSITDDAFDFLLGVQTETIYKGSIFDTPPSNIPSNIDNGALGYFMTCSVVRDTILVE